MYSVEFVETKSNRIPFKDFIDELSLTEQADVFASINKLCEFKNKNLIVPSNITKYLRDGIFELRVKHKNRITRTFYFYYIDRKIIITHGFIKKTEKVPKIEIEKALKFRSEFFAK
jgi:phage-related protein